MPPVTGACDLIGCLELGRGGNVTPRLFAAGLALAILSVCVPHSGVAQSATAHAQLLHGANITLNHFKEDPAFRQAAEMISSAPAIYIVPKMIKGGFIFGAEGGDGVLLVRHGNSWGTPKFYSMGSGSFGLQIGLEQAELVFIINSREALRDIEQGELKLGAGAGITVVTLFSAAEGATTTHGGDMVVWSSGTGAYGGIHLNGSVIKEDKDPNVDASSLKEATTLLANLATLQDGTSLNPAPPIHAPRNHHPLPYLPRPLSLTKPVQAVSPPHTRTTEFQPKPPVPKLDVKYNAPSSIPLAAVTDFRLIIASSHAASTGDFNGAPGPVEGHRISKVNHAKAVMSGPKDFVDISSGSAACQTVSANDNPSWDWSVTPKTTQPFDLQVDIWEVGPDCNTAAPIVHRIDNFTITVTATWWQAVTDWLTRLDPGLKVLFELIAAAGGAFAAWKWLLPALRGTSA